MDNLNNNNNNNMQQQQQQEMVNSAQPPSLQLISSELIQKYLVENENLIRAILESQGTGTTAKVAKYEEILHSNLLYLAALADIQPQESTTPSQLPSNFQQGGSEAYSGNGIMKLG